MAYVAQVISTSLTSYDGGNELVGQVKNLIVNNAPSGLVTVVSDNNPAAGSGIARIVNLQVGNSGHYLRLTGTTTPSGTPTFRNLANNGNLGSTSISLGNGSTVYLILSQYALVLRSSSGYCVVYFKDSVGNMWGTVTSGSNVNSFYPWNSDSTSSFTVAAGYSRASDGTSMLVRSQLSSSTVFGQSLYSFNNVDTWPLSAIVQDGAGTYYILLYTSGSSISVGSVTTYPALLLGEA